MFTEAIASVCALRGGFGGPLAAINDKKSTHLWITPERWLGHNHSVHPIVAKTFLKWLRPQYLNTSRVSPLY